MIYRDVEEAWICAACRSSDRIRSAPAAWMRSATRRAEIGTRRLILSILPCVSVIGKHCRDTVRRRALQRIDHQQEFHQIAVHRRAGRLDHENIRPRTFSLI